MRPSPKARIQILPVLALSALALPATRSMPTPHTGLGVRCGSGTSGTPGHIEVRVDMPRPRHQIQLQIATEPAAPGEPRPTTELEVRAAGRSATCRATDPSPFVIEATGLSFGTAQVVLRSQDSLVVEVRDPANRILASARLYPPRQDATTLRW